MRMALMGGIIACIMAVLTPASFAAETDFAGLYQGKGVALEMMKVGDGKFEGVVTAESIVMHFTAQQKGDALVGTLTEEGETYEFRITLKGQILTLVTNGETETMTRAEIASAPPAPPSSSSSSTSAASRPAGPAAASTSKTLPPLRVNGVVIDDAQLHKFEQEHHLTMPRGSFWYDKVSGGWGVEGGPTAGFTAPGIDLGGALRGDASRGNTGVFINGRELPWQDVQGLQAMNVPVALGRWWVDSTGNFGVEGEPYPLGNLFQFSRGKGGAYQRSTAGGYIGGDGQTSYFFDPSSGASVMTGN